MAGGKIIVDNRVTAILAIVFGIVILIVPQILAYMIGIFLIIVGILFFVSKR